MSYSMSLSMSHSMLCSMKAVRFRQSLLEESAPEESVAE